MSLLRKIQDSRLRRLDELNDVDLFASKYFSGTTLSLWKAARFLTSEQCRGLVLDAGGGRGTWRKVIEERAERESIDIAPKGGEKPTWVADLTDMPQVPSSRYDVVVFHQVLEHIHTPGLAVAEIWRVLKPGGKLVVSVPHLSRQHELPHDYTRYTPNGLRQLLEANGFVVENLETYGGIFSFVHHQFATAFIGIFAMLGPLAKLSEWLNAPISWLSWKLDSVTDRKGLLAVGVIALAQKE